MKYFLILLFATSTFSVNVPSFGTWQLQSGISIKGPEKNLRKRIFLAHVAEIAAHNADITNTYQKGLNMYSHLGAEEFIESRCKTVLPEDLVQLATGGKLKAYTTSKAKTTKTTKMTKKSSTKTTSASISTTAKPSGYPFGSYTSENAPASVDYSYLMTPPQDQGGCGSCWAFGALAQIEAMMKIRGSSYKTVLGPQYLVDCDKINAACVGGWPRKAMEWIKAYGNNSAPSMTDYPYTAKGETCKTSIEKLVLNIKSVNQKYFSGNEASLKAQIANYGPAAVAIQVTGNFQSYQGGVFYDATCPSGIASCSTVNHAVVVTGYGTDPVNGDYWMVKNSWSDNWGEKGYIRMARNKDNNCNIACWAIWSM